MLRLHMGHKNSHASYFLNGVGTEEGVIVFGLGVIVDGSSSVWDN